MDVLGLSPCVVFVELVLRVFLARTWQAPDKFGIAVVRPLCVP